MAGYLQLVEGAVMLFLKADILGFSTAGEKLAGCSHDGVVFAFLRSWWSDRGGLCPGKEETGGEVEEVLDRERQEVLLDPSSA
jgi:hypothetical protein